MMFSISSKEKIPYIRHPFYENLFVLPYVNHRLVFADLAVKAIAYGGFDIVLLDLPNSLEEGGLLDLIMEAFPLASSLVITPPDKRLRVLHFTPNDAACAALYCLKMMHERGHNHEFDCIDDSNIMNYPPGFFMSMGTGLPDDYFAKIDGIEAYFLKAFKKMESLWADLPAEESFFWKHRAGVVARRLNRLLREGKKTLFICNHRLFWAVDRAIRSREYEDSKLLFTPPRRDQFLVSFQNPQSLWVRGILDDYPAVVNKFFQKIKEGDPGSFDKLQVLDEILSKVTGEKSDRRKLNLSTRSLMIFFQYLIPRLRLHRRMTPTLTTFLFPAAFSCLGQSLAKDLLNALLEYPEVDKDFVSFLINNYNCRVTSDKEFILSEPKNQISINAGAFKTHGNSLLDMLDTSKSREELLSFVKPFLKAKEIRKLVGKENDTRWAVKEEYIFHSRINNLVHSGLRKLSRRFQTFRSWGDMADGIDWQETIHSRLTGEDAIYVKKFRKGGFNKGQLNDFTPIFLIFDKTPEVLANSIHDSNITQRYMELGIPDEIREDFPKPDFVYSVFYTTHKTEVLCSGHIRKQCLTSILFLCSQPWMGPERYRKITARPSKFQCRSEPQTEADINSFIFRTSWLHSG